MKLDDNLAKYIVDNVGILESIHPNIITLFGLMLNFVIFYLISHHNLHLMFVVLYARYLADCLDGAVARKYNKQSKLGGYFDTISDGILLVILTHMIVTSFHLSSYWYLLPLVQFLYMDYLGALSNHQNIKRSDGTFTDIVAFLTNNTIIIYTFIFGLYIYIIKI
jgi:phosphatidylglycerophosphate synthase